MPDTFAQRHEKQLHAWAAAQRSHILEDLPVGPYYRSLSEMLLSNMLPGDALWAVGNGSKLVSAGSMNDDRRPSGSTLEMMLDDVEELETICRDEMAKAEATQKADTPTRLSRNGSLDGLGSALAYAPHQSFDFQISPTTLSPSVHPRQAIPTDSVVELCPQPTCVIAKLAALRSTTQALNSRIKDIRERSILTTHCPSTRKQTHCHSPARPKTSEITTAQIRTSLGLEDEDECKLSSTPSESKS